MPIIPATPIPAETTNMATITALNARVEPVARAAGLSEGVCIFHFLNTSFMRSVLFRRRLKNENVFSGATSCAQIKTTSVDQYQVNRTNGFNLGPQLFARSLLGNIT